MTTELIVQRLKVYGYLLSIPVIVCIFLYFYEAKISLLEKENALLRSQIEFVKESRELEIKQLKSKNEILALKSDAFNYIHAKSQIESQKDLYENKIAKLTTNISSISNQLAETKNDLEKKTSLLNKLTTLENEKQLASSHLFAMGFLLLAMENLAAEKSPVIRE